MENEIKKIKQDVAKVAESLTHFMESGHVLDNISHLTTNASILKIIGNKLLDSYKFNSQIKNILEKEDEFRYMLLGRLKTDCEYYLGNGNRRNKHLWAPNENRQIRMMKELHNSFPDDAKPEWLTMDEILEYERKMIKTEDNE
mgnify:CR=1 FL=1